MPPLTRSSFSRRFGRRAVFAMVHLGALPGAPGYGGSLDSVLRRAAADARAIRNGRADGIIVENFGDRPFEKAYLIHLFQWMIDRGSEFHRVNTHGGYMELDTLEDLELAQDWWEGRS